MNGERFLTNALGKHEHEMLHTLTELLEKKRMGTPLSLEERTQAHFIVGALPEEMLPERQEQGERRCSVCRDMGHRVPTIVGFDVCRDHLHETVHESVRMTA